MLQKRLVCRDATSRDCLLLQELVLPFVLLLDLVQVVAFGLRASGSLVGGGRLGPELRCQLVGGIGLVTVEFRCRLVLVVPRGIVFGLLVKRRRVRAPPG